MSRNWGEKPKVETEEPDLGPERKHPNRKHHIETDGWRKPAGPNDWRIELSRRRKHAASKVFRWMRSEIGAECITRQPQSFEFEEEGENA